MEMANKRTAGLIQRLWSIKVESEALAADRSDLSSRLIEALKDQKSETVSVDGGDIRATVVRSSTTSVDIEAIVSELDETLAAKCYKQVIDPKKVEALVALGEISEELVAAHTSSNQRSPYIRLDFKAAS
jgi:hypothetical protein